MEVAKRPLQILIFSDHALSKETTERFIAEVSPTRRNEWGEQLRFFVEPIEPHAGSNTYTTMIQANGYSTDGAMYCGGFFEDKQMYMPQVFDSLVGDLPVVESGFFRELDGLHGFIYQSSMMPPFFNVRACQNQ